MSRENVAEYRRGIAAWNSGDLDAWLSAVDRDWEYRSSGQFPGLQPVYRGVEGARQLWSDMRGPWEEFRIDIERIEDLGDTLVALVTFHVTGRDGLATSRRWAHVGRSGGGRPTTENYASWEEALKAVELED
jgi:ketosteroid isomerase-like protein